MNHKDPQQSLSGCSTPISMKIMVDLFNQISQKLPHLENLEILTNQNGLIEDIHKSYIILQCFDREIQLPKILNVFLTEDEQTKNRWIEIEKLFHIVKKELEYDCLLKIYNMYSISSSSTTHPSEFFLIESEKYENKTAWAMVLSCAPLIYNFLKRRFEDKLNWKEEYFSNFTFTCKSGENTLKRKYNIIHPNFIKGIKQDTENKKNEDSELKIIPNYIPTQIMVESSKWQEYLNNFYNQEREQLSTILKHINDEILQQHYTYFDINGIGKDEINLTVLTQNNQLFNLHYHQVDSKEKAEQIKDDYKKLIKLRESLGIKSNINLLEITPDQYLVEVKETQREKTVLTQDILDIKDPSLFMKSLCLYISNLQELILLGFDEFLNPESLNVDRENLYYMNPLHFKQEHTNSNIKLIIQCFTKVMKYGKLKSSHFVQTYFQSQIKEFQQFLEIKQFRFEKSIYGELLETLHKFESMLLDSNFQIKNNWDIVYHYKLNYMVIEPIKTLKSINKLALTIENSSLNIDTQSIISNLQIKPNFSTLSIKGTTILNFVNLSKLSQYTNLRSIKIMADNINQLPLIDLFNCESLIQQLECLSLQSSYKVKRQEISAKYIYESLFHQTADAYLVLKRNISPHIQKLSIYVACKITNHPHNQKHYLIDKGILIDSENIEQEQVLDSTLEDPIQSKMQSPSQQQQSNCEKEKTIFNQSNESNKEQQEVKSLQKNSTAKEMPDTSFPVMSLNSFINNLQSKQNNMNQNESSSLAQSKEDSNNPQSQISSLFIQSQQKPQVDGLFSFSTNQTNPFKNDFLHAVGLFAKPSEPIKLYSIKSNKKEELHLEEFLNNPITQEHLLNIAGLDAGQLRKDFETVFKKVMSLGVVDISVIQRKENTLVIEFSHKKYKEYGKLRVQFNNELDIVDFSCLSKQAFYCENTNQTRFYPDFIDKWEKFELQRVLFTYLIGDSYQIGCKSSDYLQLQQQFYKDKQGIQSLSIDILSCDNCIENNRCHLGLNPSTHSNLSKLSLNFLEHSIQARLLEQYLNELKLLPKLTHLTLYFNISQGKRVLARIYRLKRLVNFKILYN